MNASHFYIAYNTKSFECPLAQPPRLLTRVSGPHQSKAPVMRDHSVVMESMCICYSV